jgi:hypothetical protein
MTARTGKRGSQNKRGRKGEFMDGNEAGSERSFECGIPSKVQKPGKEFRKCKKATNLKYQQTSEKG